MQFVTRSFKTQRHSDCNSTSTRAMTRLKRSHHRKVRRLTRQALRNGQEIPDIRPLTAWDIS